MQTYSDDTEPFFEIEKEQELCDEELVREFEAEEKERGLLSEEEIARGSSRMIARLMQRKWEREGNKEVVMASGRVTQMPGCGNVYFSDADKEAWKRLDRLEEETWEKLARLGEVSVDGSDEDIE